MSRDIEGLKEFASKNYLEDDMIDLRKYIENYDLYITEQVYLPTERINTCVIEAISSFVIGNINSCIFSCVSAIDMIIRFEIIENSDNPIEACEIIEKDGYTFGRLKDALAKKDNGRKKPLIELINDKTFEKFEGYIDDLDWLNKTRNYIAVHPPFLNEGSMNNPELGGKMISYELAKLSKIINLEDLPVEGFVIEEGSKIGVKEILKNPSQQNAMRVRQMNYEPIINFIAFKTIQKTFEILNGLYT